MPFLQLTFDVGAADPSPLEEALFDLGATSVTLEDAADSPILEPRVGTTPLWPTVRLRALFDASTDRPQLIRALHARLGASIPPHQSEQLADRAWEREWLKDFKPMRFGERLWICPGGQHPAADLLTENVCLLHLDPGLAFGTGTHPTTALCLEWLDSRELTGQTIVDYGCGSGILAIAALKLGASSATGIDIDPQALLATRDNAERNGVLARLDIRSNELAAPAPADIVLANILAAPLVELAPQLAALVRDDGELVLSGLLTEQVDPVATCYASWFDMTPPVTRGDWVRLHGRKRRTSIRGTSI